MSNQVDQEQLEWEWSQHQALKMFRAVEKQNDEGEFFTTERFRLVKLLNYAADKGGLHKVPDQGQRTVGGVLLTHALAGGNNAFTVSIDLLAKFIHEACE